MYRLGICCGDVIPGFLYLKKVQQTHAAAQINSQQAAEIMVNTHLKKNPPSVYEVGETVLINNVRKRGKIKAKQQDRIVVGWRLGRTNIQWTM